MQTVEFRESHLWRRTLAKQPGEDPYEDSRSRLRLSFEKSRNSISPLVSQIGAQLPSLTVHDITHLDSLWHVADILLGPGFPITPAEAYVLGMSFLMHDAATSTFAFPNGLEGLKTTPQWKDIVLQRELDETSLLQGTQDYQLVLFETLRMLHAKQAAKLPTQGFKDLSGLERYLIEDVELRNHYGREIGRIAASHGENISSVEERWAYSAPLAPHSSLAIRSDSDWRVDSLKVALILRCVDAAHIDSLRAPDALAVLTRPQGESANHWIFQNRLSALAINNSEELYWSSAPFDVENSEAWWRCYDTARMIDGEIKSCNRMLQNNTRQVLRARGVAGASSTSEFSLNVPVEGWTPLDFEFKVSQVGTVIEQFGGKRLYGEKPYLALRELLQNASDAIRARRTITKKEFGNIQVSLVEKDAGVWLQVQDTGIGMSSYVLTDVLLDFGRSIWKDAAVRYEWTGLVGEGFKPVGKFGIGFFSVFMLGEEVKVSTWRFGSSINEQVTLHIRHKTRMRPLILPTDENDRLQDFGTRVEIKLYDGRKSLLRKYSESSYVRGRWTKYEVEESLKSLVGYLAPTLDIDVNTCDTDGVILPTVRANDWKQIPATELLQRLLPYDSDETIKQYAGEIREIYGSKGELLGRACITAEARYYSRERPCVLSHRGLLVGTCYGLVGVLEAENNSDLARENAVPLVSGSEMKRWAEEQLIDSSCRSSPKFSERANSLGVIDKSLIVGTYQGKSVSIGDLIEMLTDPERDELVFALDEPDCPTDMSQDDFEEFVFDDDIIDLSNCSAAARFDFGFGPWLERNLPELEDKPRTIKATLEYLFFEAFSDLECEDDFRKIGEAESVAIDGSCLVIRKIAEG